MDDGDHKHGVVLIRTTHTWCGPEQEPMDESGQERGSLSRVTVHHELVVVLVKKDHLEPVGRVFTRTGTFVNG